MKISLANSLGQLFMEYGVDPAKVAVMENDPRIGTGYLTPGSPITGPCLPRDNKALVQAAGEVNVELPLSEATMDVQAQWYLDLVRDINSTSPATLGIVGMVYKEGTDVTTDSVGEYLQGQFKAWGFAVKTYDKVVPSDDYEDVLACDVVVVTQRGLVPEHAKGRVISLW
jgi:UDPglucose 6-dehydrogenase